MAMGCQPEIVVFDEPTTALDVTTQIEVLSAIKEAVRARASAAIYITHDLAVVAQVCLLYTSPSTRDGLLDRKKSSA